MKSRLVLPILLALAAPAMAAEPQSSTLAIDPETGEFRAATAEEQAELAAQEQSLREEAAAQRALQPKSGRVMPAPMGFTEPPATAEEAEKTLYFRPDGIGVMRAPASSYSRAVVTRDAEGNLVVSHEDAGQEHAHE